MNIFVLDYDIQQAAVYHNDSHVVKMILESAQLLSTACRLSGVDHGYKSTHINHPCSKWARESLDNWLWLRELSMHLNSEWQFRFNHTRNHKSYDVIMTLPMPKIERKGITPFALAMPDVYKSDDPVVSYRNYYNNAKHHLFKWTKRKQPEWIHGIS